MAAMQLFIVSRITPRAIAHTRKNLSCQLVALPSASESTNMFHHACWIARAVTSGLRLQRRWIFALDIYYGLSSYTLAASGTVIRSTPLAFKADCNDLMSTDAMSLLPAITAASPAACPVEKQFAVTRMAACASCVDTDIRRVRRERRNGGNAGSET